MSKENKIVELTDEQTEKAAGGDNSETQAKIKEILDELKILFKKLNELEDGSEKDAINKRIEDLKKQLADLQMSLLDDPNMFENPLW